MDQDAVRAYAVRGLTTRLTELDAERTRILALLASLGESVGMDAPAELPPVPAVTRRRRAPRVMATQAALPQPSAEVEPEVVEREEARILPRRRAPRAAVVVEAAAPVLPPMPRLVKATVAS